MCVSKTSVNATAVRQESVDITITPTTTITVHSLLHTYRRNGVVVDLVFPSDNVFNGADTLRRRGVRQHHFSIGVANAVQVGNDLTVLEFGHDLHLFIHVDKATLGLHARFFQSHGGRIGDTSRGHHARIHLERFHVLLGLGVNHFNGNGLDTGNPGRDFRGKHGSLVVNGAVPNEQALGLLGNLAIKRGHDIVHGFNERDFAAQAVE